MFRSLIIGAILCAAGGLTPARAQTPLFGQPPGPSAPPPAAQYVPPENLPAGPALPGIATPGGTSANSVSTGSGAYFDQSNGSGPSYGGGLSYGGSPAYGGGPAGGTFYGGPDGSSPPGSVIPANPRRGNFTYFDMDDLPPPRWTFRVDALFLQRTVGTDNYLGGVYNFNTGATVANLTAADNGFSMQPGLRLQLGLNVSDDISWQAIFYGLQNWNTGHTLYANPWGANTVASSYYTQTDWLIGGFGTSLGYSYSSSLLNFELNRVRQREGFGNWTWGTLAGFRYFQWNESFNLNGYDQYYPAFENISVRTNNYLFGGQIGAQARYDRNRFHLQMVAKSALMANVAYIHSSNLNSSGYLYGSPPGFQGYAGGGFAGNVAGVLDFSAVASYNVSPHFLLRGGYQMLYIPGLDLAPGQLDDTIHRGGVFLHGPMVGMEVNW